MSRIGLEQDELRNIRTVMNADTQASKGTRADIVKFRYSDNQEGVWGFDDNHNVVDLTISKAEE